jgi:protein transport protein SEC61 subunit alpha
LLTSGLITQLIARTNILESISLKVNPKNQKILEKNMEKLLAIGLCLGQAVAYVGSGMYGKLDTLGHGNATIIVMQLFFAGFFMILFDEILTLRYGIINSGLSLFIAVNVCTEVVWKAFAPIVMYTNKNGLSSDFIGICPAIVKSIYLSICNPLKAPGLLYSLMFDRGLGNECIHKYNVYVMFIYVIYGYLYLDASSYIFLAHHHDHYHHH